jgi:hypothetical protein
LCTVLKPAVDAVACVEYALKNCTPQRFEFNVVMPQMIIANRLSDGLVVFLAPEERWDVAIAGGCVIDTETDAAELLAIAKRHEGEAKVVDPQLIDVEMRDGQPRPTAIREAIRAFGPTVRTDAIEA